MTEIYIAPVGALNPVFLNRISQSRKESLAQMQAVSARELSLCAELLVRALICDELGVGNDSLRIERSRSGKPFLPDYPELHFNLSHTNGVIAAAIAHSPVGIDIERCDRKIQPRVIARICSDAEAESLENGLRPIELWTKKEALIKCCGRGDVPLNRLDTHRGDIATWPIEDYIVSVCCKTLPTMPLLLGADEFYKMLMGLNEICF